MTKFFWVVFALVVGAVGVFAFRSQSKTTFSSPLLREEIQKERFLDRYTIDALSKTKLEASEISLGEILNDDGEFTSYKFYFYVEGRKVSGLLNIPRETGEYPVIVMFRGYVDKERYQTGVGTQRAAEVFAQNRFIALAPDFLGYGESDNPSENPVEERFQTYLSALILLESVKNLNTTLANNSIDSRANSQKVGIWGHSNGGQIALTVLEITGRAIPTVLWAPVAKPFPYSVLYYTDDFDDRGKMLRRVIAEFEKDYDAELYNLTKYFDRLNAPLVIHQGTADESVPQKWSDELVSELKKLDKDVSYFTYTGADHNLLPSGWNLAVSRAIEFYSDRL